MSYHPSGVKVATDPVYHYTDGAALIGIARIGVLWASAAAGLNDRAEVRQGWEQIEAWLNRQPPSDIIDLFKDHAANPHRASHEVFVVCGSTRGDDANQWRLYANRGAGYAVELDPQQPLTVLADEAPKKDEESRRGRIARVGDHVEVSPWLHVIYDDHNIDDALTQLVAETKARADSIANSDADDNDKSDGLEHLGDTTYSALAEIAHLIKEPGSSGENEVRIVVTFPWRGRHVKYRSGAYGVVGSSSAARRAATPGVASLRGTRLDRFHYVPYGPVRYSKDHVPSI